MANASVSQPQVFGGVMTYRSELFALVVLTSLLISPALGLDSSHPVQSGVSEPPLEARDDETSLHIHEVYKFAVHQRQKRSIEEDETVYSDGYTLGDNNDEELKTSVEEVPGSERYAVEDSEDQELVDQPSAWPKFGIVGERQAALYYSSFLVFTVFLYRNSGGANSRGANNLPKSGRY
ncbi:g9845 [Coccomyxa elongata]